MTHALEAYELSLIYKFLKSETDKNIKSDRSESVFEDRHFLLFKDSKVVIVDGGTFALFLNFSPIGDCFEKEFAVRIKDFLEVGKLIKKNTANVELILSDNAATFSVGDSRVEKKILRNHLTYEKVLGVTETPATQEKLGGEIPFFDTGTMSRLCDLLSFYGDTYFGVGKGLTLSYAHKRYFLETANGFAVLMGLKSSLSIGVDKFEFFKSKN